MNALIDLKTYPVKHVLHTLLEDKSTGGNIVFATDAYAGHGEGFGEKDEITRTAILGLDSVEIQPRALKNADAKKIRTKEKAEVFTPSWLCSRLIDMCDEDWLKEGSSFTDRDGKSWKRTDERLAFKEGTEWKKYVDARRLELACGEAPFIAFRYDPWSGKKLKDAQRTGVLDRKMRVVDENAAHEDEWLKWAFRALESVYGFELQGDSLLIARANILCSFAGYIEEGLKRNASLDELARAANIISWNFWQMDGLTGEAPFAERKRCGQIEMDILSCEEEKTSGCRLFDWRAKRYAAFGGEECFRFDLILGNPPYHEHDGGAAMSAVPAYNRFIAKAKEMDPRQISMIIPAKWFSGGKGLREFREEMLSDKHITKMIDYVNSYECFPYVSIAGGVCMFFMDSKKTGSCLYTSVLDGKESSEVRRLDEFKTFIRYPKALSIVRKVTKEQGTFLNAYVSPRKPFGLDTQASPTETGDIMLRYNGGSGVYRSDLIRKNKAAVGKWKVIISYLSAEHAGQPDKNGKYRILATMEKLPPGYACSETYLLAGSFFTEARADNFMSYLKTKFVRFLILQLAMTQHLSRAMFSFVPEQDWSRSYTDVELYDKYGLSEEERDFIEEMMRDW